MFALPQCAHAPRRPLLSHHPTPSWQVCSEFAGSVLAYLILEALVWIPSTQAFLVNFWSTDVDISCTCTDANGI